MKKALSIFHLGIRNHYMIMFILIVIGFAVRILGITNIPSGVNQDEASIGYEAFSILHTGCDRNANSFPVHLVSWGSGQNALYAYLSIPFIHFLGLNIYSVRIVNALFSCLSLLIFYLLFKSIFDKKKSLIALAFLAICPWSIMSARWGLESNIFPPLFLLAVYFLIKGISSSQKYFPVSFVTFAVCLYSYGTSYLILPLFFLFVIPYLLHKKIINLSIFTLSLILFVIVALPIITFVIINHLNLHQIHIAGITIPKLDNNRTTVIFNLFNGDFGQTLIKNIVRFLSIMLTQTDGTIYNVIPSIGTIYFISFPFFIIGLFNIIKNRYFINNPTHFIFFSWLICSIILGCMSHVNINRINIIFIPILYFTIFGFSDVENMLRSEYKKYYPFSLIGLYFIYFCFFCGNYFFIFNDEIKSSFSYGLGDAIQYAEKIKTNDKINITTNTINMPYIYVCFYNKIEPTNFIKTVVYKDNNNGFKEVGSFGRYTFGKNKLNTNIVSIFSKDEMEIFNIDFSKYKNFGNYYIVQGSKFMLLDN